MSLKLGLRIGAVILALIAGWLIYRAVQNYFVGDLETKLDVSNAQTRAAIESGKQAVEIQANRQAAEQAGAAIVVETQHEIDKATDPGGVTDAGLNGLHRIRESSGPRPRR